MYLTLQLVNQHNLNLLCLCVKALGPEVPVKEEAQAALQKSQRLLNQAKQLQNDVRGNRKLTLSCQRLNLFCIVLYCIVFCVPDESRDLLVVTGEKVDFICHYPFLFRPYPTRPSFSLAALASDRTAALIYSACVHFV